MARIRTIKPDFWKHEDLSQLPEATHLLAAALLNYADDEGYFNANPKLIQAELFPLREPSVSIHDSLSELARIGYIDLGGGDDGRRYGRVVKFSEHQRINRKTPSKIKSVNIVWEDAVRTHTQLSDVLPLEGKGREEEQGREGKGLAAASDEADDASSVYWGFLDDLAERSKTTPKRMRGVMGRLNNVCDGDTDKAIQVVVAARQKEHPLTYITGAINRIKDENQQRASRKTRSGITPMASPAGG